MNRGILNSDIIDKLKESIRERIDWKSPSLPEITCAASLAHHILHMKEGSDPNRCRWLRWTTLADVDLSSVPPDHLESMVSCVGRMLNIRNNVRGSGLVRILSNVKSDGLTITHQSLDVEETQALVKSMESVGYGLTLILGEGVTLDIKTLTTYSGQGQCHGVYCSGDTAARYSEELKTWAKSKNWKEHDDDDFDDLTMTRY